MEDINFLSIIISASISLLVSIIVLFSGIRIGKERSEHNELREKYRALFKIIFQMKKNISENKTVQNELDYFADKKAEGEYLELNIDVYDSIEKIENQYHDYMENLDNWAEKVFNTSKPYAGVIDQYSANPRFLDEERRFIIEETFDIKKDKLENLLTNLPKEQDSKEIDITLIYNYGTKENELLIKNSDLAQLTISEVLKKIFKDNEEQLKKIRNEKNELSFAVDTLLKTISKKVKTPHSSIDTIKDSFKDIK